MKSSMKKLTMIIMVFAFVCLSSSLDPKVAVAQATQVQRWLGPLPGFGYFVHTLSDEGGNPPDPRRDGIPDIIIGQSCYGTNCPTGDGAVYVYSGKDFSLIFQLSGTAWSYAVDAGDLNGDGVSDLFVGENTFSSLDMAVAYSGLDGAPIPSLAFYSSGPSDTFGVCVSGIGDITGDGIPDLLVGAQGSDYIILFSGADGSLIKRIDGPAGSNFGRSVSEAGDVNGDGTPDFIVGAPHASPSGNTFAGSAFVYSGRADLDFPLIYEFDGENSGDQLGGCCGSVDSVGDLNGDGKPELAVTAVGADPNGMFNAGSVYIFDGATGAPFQRFDGLGPMRFDGENVGDSLGGEPTFCACGWVAKVGDIDGDGYPDFMAGAPLAESGAGRVLIFSGYDSSVLLRIGNPDGDVYPSYFGVGGAVLGDINGDGGPEILIGAGRIQGPEEGNAYVLSLEAVRNLVSISVTPANPTINVGQTQQFTATGTFSDGSTDVLGSPAMVISAGSGHTCAVLSNATVRCWGGNSNGQLGDGTTTDSSTPVVINGMTSATAIAAGLGHTCAVLLDGTVRCWGANGFGQLGAGSTTDSTIPVMVSGITTATAVTAGAVHTCALLSDGTVRCWGVNLTGELGNGTNTGPEYCTPYEAPYSCSTTPAPVSGISSAIAIDAREDHTCVVLSDGTVKCWGFNYMGQLGDGTTTDSATPVTVNGLTSATAIATGFSHTCAALTDHTVLCWGSNFNGELGDGTTTSSFLPVAVNGITNAIAIDAGFDHTCALISDGTLECWGENLFGGLGDGTTVNSSIPVAVSGINNAASFTAGEFHTCGLLSNGTLKCWGYNGQGGLGDGYGSGIFSTTPVAVSGITGGPAVVWSSSNTTVATIDQNGLATGLSPGATTIRATSGSISGSTTLTMANPNQPDLTMTAVTPNASTANQGGTLSMTDTVHNQGTAAAGSFRIAYHLSTNTTYGDSDDIVISTIRVVTSIGAGASNIATTSLSIPSNAPGGTYHLCAMADSLNQVDEGGNEGNNTLCSTSTVTLPTADLLMTAVSTATTAIAPGKTLSVSNTVMNQGGFGAGSFRIGFYLSVNSDGSTNDAAITATRTLSSLGAGATSTGSTTLTIPSDAPLGTYYVCAQADALSQVAETNELNNTLCTGSTIQLTLPDLIMTDVTPNAATANKGGTLSVTTTVSNEGSASGAFRIAFHLSSDAVYGNGDDVVITITRSVTSLAAGGSSTGTTSLTIPGATPSNDYYVCTLADSLSQVAETNEGNNTLCSGGTVMVQ